MNKVHQMLHGFLEFKETYKHGINKETNFKLNHDVATKCGVRQSWATCFFLTHLGCLRLGMLEP